ncbi:AAA family ATPase [Patescibacteria group bacterium]|nr:AAA family ATPase [Patescibacteria group bacterium]
MKLIVLYGAPASGKLTLAKKVAEVTGYRLFHNHLTVDLLKELLEFGTPEFYELNHQLKLDLLEATAKQGRVSGVICTFAYDKKTDNPFIDKLKEISKRQDIDLQFIQIYCDREELLKRVTEDSRKEYKKIHSVEGLSKCLESGDFMSEVAGVNSKRIDSTDLSVEEAVAQVVELIK